jgi:hypothetical protein
LIHSFSLLDNPDLINVLIFKKNQKNLAQLIREKSPPVEYWKRFWYGTYLDSKVGTTISYVDHLGPGNKENVVAKSQET